MGKIEQFKQKTAPCTMLYGTRGGLSMSAVQIVEHDQNQANHSADFVLTLVLSMNTIFTMATIMNFEEDRLYLPRMLPFARSYN